MSVKVFYIMFLVVLGNDNLKTLAPTKNTLKVNEEIKITLDSILLNEKRTNQEVMLSNSLNVKVHCFLCTQKE